MIDTTEIAPGIYRIAMVGETDLIEGGLVLPGSYNLFLIADDHPAIINTMMRRSFGRLQARVAEILDPASIRYIVVPHHEGDSDGAVNEWLSIAPAAVPLATELCAVLSLRDLADREVRTVEDGETLELGQHVLRFLHTPYINQWDSLMVYEERTGTLFPNDLFASPIEGAFFNGDPTEVCLTAAREFGYMSADRSCLEAALAKVETAAPARIATMHGPVLTAHLDALVAGFRQQLLAPAT